MVQNLRLCINTKHLFMYDFYSERKLANEAMDLFINQFQEKGFGLPAGCLNITDPKYAKFKFRTAENGGSAMEYYKILKDDPDHVPESEYGFVILDENGNPTELTGEQKDAIEGSVRSFVEEQIKNAQPGTKSRMIEHSVWWKPKPTKIRWQNVLRQFATSVPSLEHRSTRTRPSRFHESRYGVRQNFTYSLLVMLDVSGSVDDEYLKEGFNELHILYKKGYSIDVIQVDTQILHHEQYKGKWKGLTRKGGGGTCLKDGVEMFVKGKYDGLVCFTDGEFGTTPIYNHPKARKSLWLHYPGYSLNTGLPGKKISM